MASIAKRLSDLIKGRRADEGAWIMQLDVKQLDALLYPLLNAFICLNFLDVCLTSFALSVGPVFRELNPLIAYLLELRPYGFLFALVLKYLPLAPLAYMTFVREQEGKRRIEIMELKLAGLLALIGSNLYLFFVVFVHDLPTLLYGLVLLR